MMQRLGRGFSGGGGIAPLQAGLPVLWYAASLSPMTLNGAALVQWDDLSPSAAAASQTISSNQPAYQASALNGLPGVVFDGNNDWLDLGTAFNPGNDSITLFTVAKYNAGAPTNGRLIQNRGTGSLGAVAGFYLRAGSANVEFVMDDGAGTNRGSSIASDIRDGAWRIFTALINRDADTITLRVSGLADGPSVDISTVGDITSTRHTTLGCAWDNGASQTQYLGGAIAEVIAYDRPLSDSAIDLVTAYLQTRYGL